jgi:hypothetical protein
MIKPWFTAGAGDGGGGVGAGTVIGPGDDGVLAGKLSSFKSSVTFHQSSKPYTASASPMLAANISAVGVPLYGGRSDSCILQAAKTDER